MPVLGIDVCTGLCAVAIVDGARILADMREPMQRGHAERLAPMVAEALEEAGLRPADLTAISVTTGPGSFTGARLGVSFARGLALALDVPAVGVSVFEVLAAKVRARPLVVALDGKRDQVFVQIFDASDSAPVALPLDTAWQSVPTGATVIAGPGWDTIRSHAPHPLDVEVARDPVVDPVTVARLGRDRLSAGEDRRAAPLYLRAPDAKAQPAVSLR